MKIKRFFSSDMRNVIRMVREELGPDAVILSNSRVNGGVEVVAAVDYDESIFAHNNGGNPAAANRNASDNEMPPAQDRPAQSAEPEQDKLTLTGSAQQPAASPRAADNGSRRKPAQDKRAAHLQPQANAQQPAQAAKRRPKARSAEFDELSDEQKKQSDFSFYLLDDDEKDSPRISDTLFETGKAEVFPSSLALNDGEDNAKRAAAANSSVWSQEPTLVDMRNELRTLRDLLEKQLSAKLFKNSFEGCKTETHEA